MKKLIAIAPYPYLPFFSGGQKFIAGFLEHLGAETELSVVGVKTNDWTKAKNYRPFPFLKASRSRYFDRDLIKKISRIIREEKKELLIIEHPYYHWLAKAIKKRTGIKTAIHTHNIEYQRFKSTGKWWWPFMKMYEKKAFRKADLLFFITPEDKEFAISNWGISKNKCLDIPFGIEQENHPADRYRYRKIIEEKYRIQPEEKIFFFNGLLDYKPNLDALKIILNEINLELLKLPGFRYKIIICGNKLPAEFRELADYRDKNILFGGFTDDIGQYYMASDLFINPVLSGGGVKTKVVEAIGYGTTVISTEMGATGMVREACGAKLVTVKDKDWKSFVAAIIENAGRELETPGAYYSIYSWSNIVKQFKHL